MFFIELILILLIVVAIIWFGLKNVNFRFFLSFAGVILLFISVFLNNGVMINEAGYSESQITDSNTGVVIIDHNVSYNTVYPSIDENGVVMYFVQQLCFLLGIIFVLIGGFAIYNKW